VYGVTPSTTAAVALGYQAAATTTSAVGVTAIGYQALNVNSATHNTAIGYQALVSNTTGSENMAFGTSALGGVTTGSENIGIGRGAGARSVSSNRNIYIGVDAGYLMSGNNNTILGRFTGNQGGLNILSASNYIVLSDGDGNPLISTSNTRSVALSGAVPQTGTGITFPATQSASSNANTLDDYEEGTWTPTLRGDSTAGTYTLGNLIGYYTKIGNQVTCWASFTLSAASGGSGYAQFGGLPFSYKAGSAITGTIQLGTVNIGTYNYITLMRDSGSAATTMTAQTSTNNTGGTNSPISGYGTSSFVSYCITYTIS
jgi:hypothetical protein